jgi:hypothetical protein
MKEPTCGTTSEDRTPYSQASAEMLRRIVELNNVIGLVDLDFHRRYAAIILAERGAQ